VLQRLPDLVNNRPAGRDEYHSKETESIRYLNDTDYNYTCVGYNYKIYKPIIKTRAIIRPRIKSDLWVSISRPPFKGNKVYFGNTCMDLISSQPTLSGWIT